MRWAEFFWLLQNPQFVLCERIQTCLLPSGQPTQSHSQASDEKQANGASPKGPDEFVWRPRIASAKQSV